MPSAPFHEPSLSERDPVIAKLIADENRREDESMRLIASENYASRAVMEATGSCLTNKYSEGYAHKRYYEGQAVIDQVEELGAEHVLPTHSPAGDGSLVAKEKAFIVDLRSRALALKQQGVAAVYNRASFRDAKREALIRWHQILAEVVEDEK